MAAAEPPLPCLIVPEARDWLAQAVRDGGGTVVDDPAEARAVIWTAPRSTQGLKDLLSDHPDSIEWVQLPFAGIEPFVPLLDHDRAWTCGKGVYAEPVAEHALAMALAGLRNLHAYARVGSWTGPVGANLLGARVTILGGGGITESLVRLLGPFECDVTVVRRTPEPMPGVSRVVGPDALHDACTGAQVLFLALALTDETAGIVDGDLLDVLDDGAWVVNVARGGHVVTDDLVAALEAGTIAGAALDVTDPEPLPDDHPLWGMENVLITPHVGNTPEMAVPLLSARVRENVRRYQAGETLIGPVNIDAGY